nr:sorting nexin 25 [Polyrhizophydium stewartii]
MIGSVYIPFSKLPPNKLVKQWWPLDTSDSRVTSASDAEVLIEAIYINTDVDDGSAAAVASEGAAARAAASQREPSPERLEAIPPPVMAAGSPGVAAGELPAPPPPKPPRRRQHPAGDAAAWTTAQIVPHSQGFSALLQFLESRGAGDYLHLLLMVDTFQQLSATMAAGGGGGGELDPDAAENVCADAMSVLDAVSQPTASGGVLDFGDARETAAFVARLRSEVATAPGPMALAPLRARVVEYIDRVHLDAFKASEAFAAFVAETATPEDPAMPDIHGDAGADAGSPGLDEVVDAGLQAARPRSVAGSAGGGRAASPVRRGRAATTGSIPVGDVAAALAGDDPAGATEARDGLHTLAENSDEGGGSGSGASRLSRLRAALAAARARIATIDTQMETADPQAYPELLEAKFGAQTEMECLMDMVGEEEDEGAGLGVGVGAGVGAGGADVDLAQVLVTVIDATEEVAAAQQRASRAEGFLGLGGMRQPPSASSGQAAGGGGGGGGGGISAMGLSRSLSSSSTASLLSSSLLMSSSSSSSASASSSSVFPMRFQIEFKSGAPGWSLIRTYNECEQLHRMLCLHFARANEMAFPSKPAVEAQLSSSAAAAAAAMLSGGLVGGGGGGGSGMGAGSGGHVGIGGVGGGSGSTAHERRAQRLVARRVLAMDMEVYINAVVADPLLQLSKQAIAFLARPPAPARAAALAPAPSSSASASASARRGSSPPRSVRSQTSNGELQQMMFRGLRSAGSALKKLAVGAGNVADQSLYALGTSASLSASSLAALAGGGGGGGQAAAPLAPPPLPARPAVVDEGAGYDDDADVGGAPVPPPKPPRERRALPDSADAVESVEALAGEINNGGSSGEDDGTATTATAASGREAMTTMTTTKTTTTPTLPRRESEVATHLQTHEMLPQQSRLSKSDLAIILDCGFTAIEELFQLTSPTQWIRQRGLHMVRVVLHQTYGNTISTWLQGKVEDAMSGDSVVKYVDAAVVALWPNGQPFGTDPPPPVRTEHDLFDTKREAKALLVVGGEPRSGLRAPMDTVARVVGRQNAGMGMTRLFNMLQERRLNRTLMCLVLECIVKSVLNQ